MNVGQGQVATGWVCRLSHGPSTARARHLFDNGRQFAAWLGIAPRQHSSGGAHQRWF
nr:transposase [Paucibacter sp. M5-1]MCZ7882998.1 transposase [Paucibacter sp. M5-1]